MYSSLRQAGTGCGGSASPTDQQLAGAIMKTGGSVFLWAIIIFIFFKRFAADYKDEHDYRRGRFDADGRDRRQRRGPADHRRRRARVRHHRLPATPRGDERNHRIAGPRSSLRRPIARAMSEPPTCGRFAHRSEPAAGVMARPVACDVVIDQRLLRTDLPRARGSARPPSPPGAARRRATTPPVSMRGCGDHPGARRHPRPGQRHVEGGRRAPPRRETSTPPRRCQDESRALGDTEKCPRRRARRGRAPRSATSCSASPTCRTPMRPTARARTTTRSSRARSDSSTRSPSTSACRTGRRPPALGILDNERATKISGAMFTMQRGAGATLSRALCQYGARPQRRCLRGDPPAVARHAPRR